MIIVRSAGAAVSGVGRRGELPDAGDGAGPPLCEDELWLSADPTATPPGCTVLSPTSMVLYNSPMTGCKSLPYHDILIRLIVRSRESNSLAPLPSRCRANIERTRDSGLLNEPQNPARRSYRPPNDPHPEAVHSQRALSDLTTPCLETLMQETRSVFSTTFSTIDLLSQA